MGLLLFVLVHAANLQDRDGARSLLERVKGLYPRLVLLWADGGYAGQLVQWVASLFQWELQIVKRPENQKGFAVLPRRWVVERTLGWLSEYRRLSKDYEFLPGSSEAMNHLAMIHIMVRRLVT